jgi:hypothetical protein
MPFRSESISKTKEVLIQGIRIQGSSVLNKVLPSNSPQVNVSFDTSRYREQNCRIGVPPLSRVVGAGEKTPRQGSVAPTSNNPFLSRAEGQTRFFSSSLSPFPFRAMVPQRGASPNSVATQGERLEYPFVRVQARKTSTTEAMKVTLALPVLQESPAQSS